MDTTIKHVGHGPSGTAAYVVLSPKGEHVPSDAGRIILTYDEAVALQRSQLAATVEEFSGITTAPENPAHVGQVIDHIAHLDEAQIAVIRRALNSWARSGR